MYGHLYSDTHLHFPMSVRSPDRGDYRLRNISFWGLAILLRPGYKTSNGLMPGRRFLAIHRGQRPNPSGLCCEMCSSIFQLCDTFSISWLSPVSLISMGIPSYEIKPNWPRVTTTDGLGCRGWSTIHYLRRNEQERWRDAPQRGIIERMAKKHTLAGCPPVAVVCFHLNP